MASDLGKHPEIEHRAPPRRAVRRAVILTRSHLLRFLAEIRRLGVDMDNGPCLGVGMTNSNAQTTETNPDEYNGWTNRETWAASLHLSNDYGLYEMVNGWAKDARREAIEDAEEDRYDFYAKGIHNVERSTVLKLGRKLSNYIEDLRADISEHAERISSSAFPTREEVAMVLEIGSDWRVNFEEVAANWLDGFEFDGDDQ